jgi:hypothetical protein
MKRKRVSVINWRQEIDVKQCNAKKCRENSLKIEKRKKEIKKERKEERTCEREGERKEK